MGERIKNGTTPNRNQLVDQFSSLVNLFKMMFKYCEYGYSFTNLKGMLDLVESSGGSVFRAMYDNWPSQREIILCMGDTQKFEDFKMLRDMIRTFGVGIVLDGHNIKGKAVDLYRARGFGSND